MHILGLTIALLACTVLAATALPRTAGHGLAVALGLYATGLLAMLGCSALYNMAGHGRRRACQQRADQHAFWLGHVRAWRASRLSRADYAERQGLELRSLHYWIAQL